jgi:hypothetical protein
MKRNARAEIRILKARAARNLHRDTRERPLQLVAIAGALGATGWAAVYALKTLTWQRRMPHRINRG